MSQNNPAGTLNVQRTTAKKSNMVITMVNNEISIKVLRNKEISHELKDYLSDKFKSNVKSRVNLNIDQNAIPIFCKARTVP